MKYLWWRIRVTYWFVKLSALPVRHAWEYSGCMKEFFTDEYGTSDPREAVHVDMSYWET